MGEIIKKDMKKDKTIPPYMDYDIKQEMRDAFLENFKGVNKRNKGTTMTLEQNELLLKDLCASLPYKVMLNCDNTNDEELWAIDSIGLINHDYYINEVKPYLFPLSSMTEEQIHEFYCRFIENDISFEDFVADYWNTNSFHKLLTPIDDCWRVVEWFNENHCDYRGLIHMGLALDATRLNIY